jgi:hypothetical protein
MILIQAVIIIWLTMTTLCLIPAWIWIGIGGKLERGELGPGRVLIWIIITWFMLIILWPNFLGQVIAKIRGSTK